MSNSSSDKHQDMMSQMESLKDRIVAQLNNRDLYPHTQDELVEPVFLLDQYIEDKTSNKFFEASEESDLEVSVTNGIKEEFDSEPDYPVISAPGHELSDHANVMYASAQGERRSIEASPEGEYQFQLNIKDVKSALQGKVEQLISSELSTPRYERKSTAKFAAFIEPSSAVLEKVSRDELLSLIKTQKQTRK
jgi:hypothetical protein